MARELLRGGPCRRAEDVKPGPALLPGRTGLWREIKVPELPKVSAQQGVGEAEPI